MQIQPTPKNGAADLRREAHKPDFSDPTVDRNMSSPNSTQVRELALGSLHILLAVVLVLASLLAHGRVPGLTADESAALGFIFFFGLGVPLVLIGVGTLAWSLLSKDTWNVALAGSLVVAVVAMANVWTGVLASLVYLSFAVWAIMQRLQRRV